MENLQRIFHDATFSPIFKRNPKYPDVKTARINYSDIRNYECIIRNMKEWEDNSFWDDEEAEIVAKYQSIEMLVDDGWRLD
jgi:hypothetical protein